jgi:hypothetical protein
VAEALINNRWVLVIRGGLSWIGIREFLHLWDCLRSIELNGQEDRHIWKLELEDAIPLNLRTGLFSRVQLLLNHGKNYGKPRPQTNARCFFGWPSATDVGLLINLKRESYLTRSNAPYVVWTSVGPLLWWVLEPTTRWAPGTTRLVLHGT